MAGQRERGHVGIWVATGAIVAGAMAVVVVFAAMQNNRQIATVEEFKAALSEKRAFSCKITGVAGDVAEMQTSAEFKRVRLTTEVEEDAENRQYILMIEGEGTYIWDKNNTAAYKTSDLSVLDEFVTTMMEVPNEPVTEEDEGYSFECVTPDAKNLEVPEGVDFVDLSDFEIGVVR